MIPKECKRLAEVDFPIAKVSREAAKEKSGPSGHPSTIHMWWARRPLAACRAILLALLLPDPCDALCPPEFRQQARELLGQRIHRIGLEDIDLRRALLKFIADFANWDASADPAFLEVGRGLVRAAHPEETPLVVDPFAGGGSIPLEALRLGCEAFASDLNPVACLILKVLLEDIPRHGPELAEELRRAGKEVEEAAERELAQFYPLDPDGARPIAYLWARTVRCEAPNCGAEIPLARSFWLCKKAERRCALRYHAARSPGQSPSVEFQVFEPASEKEVAQGTVSRARATCPCCGNVLPPDRVRAQLAAQRGGADVVFDAKGQRVGGARLLAVVTLVPGEAGRHYRLPTETDYRAVWRASQRLNEVAGQPLPEGLSPVPDEPTPAGGGSGAGRAFSVQKYGMMRWGDLFTARQKLALTALVETSNQVGGGSRATGGVLACSLDRVVMSNMTCTRWNAVAEKMQHTFGRQALPMVWDFAEVVPIAGAPGNWQSGYKLIAKVIHRWRTESPVGQVQLADACRSPAVSESAGAWFTDPPYYDAVPYADLSDFFYVWLKRTLPGHPLLRDPFDSQNPLTPKTGEIVQDETKRSDGRPKDRAFFEAAMGRAFAEGRRVLKEDGVGCVVFAHKTTEGWEALLSGMVQGGWVITGSWPIATEMATRLRARDSAALASSVHLVCRPRPQDAGVGDWGEVLRALPNRVGDWMERLQGEGVRGADLVFACIGPALELYSRYDRVETPEGKPVPLSIFLEKVWEVVGRSALEQVLGTAEARARNGAAGALEEDARLTALFLWTSVGQASNLSPEDEETDSEDEDEEDTGRTPVPQAKGFSLVFDVVRRFAQPLGIHLPEWEGRIIETQKGVVHLLAVKERAEQLFGGEGAQAVADEIESHPAGPVQLALGLFPDAPSAAPQVLGRRQRRQVTGGPISDAALPARRQATTLDRVHAAMLLQASGRANALRALLRQEQDVGPDFLRLANALSALYPRGSEEKRLLDAMLLAVPR